MHGLTGSDPNLIILNKSKLRHWSNECINLKHNFESNFLQGILFPVYPTLWPHKKTKTYR